MRREIPENNEVGGTSQVVLVVKNPPVNAGDIKDMSLTPGLERSP